ncbi:MAG: GNAT family N-acetyltransferase, partial [Pseudomonas sp.]|nr:GNAT family N-acetyltransferase [Pseudomonas sp.]
MPLHIRPATPDDAELILRFITDLAIYEKAEHEVKTDAAGIRDSLFAEGSTAHGLICENDGQPIGYAVYFFNYSTWLGKHG